MTFVNRETKQFRNDSTAINEHAHHFVLLNRLRKREKEIEKKNQETENGYEQKKLVFKISSIFFSLASCRENEF